MFKSILTLQSAIFPFLFLMFFVYSSVSSRNLVHSLGGFLFQNLLDRSWRFPGSRRWLSVFLLRSSYKTWHGVVFRCPLVSHLFHAHHLFFRFVLNRWNYFRFPLLAVPLQTVGLHGHEEFLGLPWRCELAFRDRQQQLFPVSSRHVIG